MHSFIVGVTLCGKTTLGKKLAHLHKRQGFKTMVLTSVYDAGWNADFMTDDQEKFLRAFWDSQGCMAFIDEAAETVGRYNDVMKLTATKGRHWGHSCYYLLQTTSEIALTVRKQCTQAFVFNIGAGEAKALAAEWNQPGFLEAPSLQQGVYLRAERFGLDGRPKIARGYAFDGLPQGEA